MKTIFTGILFRLFLKRKLTFIQWLALVTLACGTATSQLPSGRARRSHVIATGAALSMVSCLLSALGGAQPTVVHAALPSARPTRRLSHFLHPPRAGIYSERLLKDRASASIHWQNMQLYVWGVGFNALGAYIKKSDAPAADAGLLTGFGTAACIVVACNAFNGLAIAAVLKCARSRRDCSRRDAAGSRGRHALHRAGRRARRRYADNIARVYAHAIAMCVTMVVSVQLFHAPVTPQLLIAIVLVATSTLQYNAPARWLRPDADGLSPEGVELLRSSEGTSPESPARARVLPAADDEESNLSDDGLHRRPSPLKVRG